MDIHFFCWVKVHDFVGLALDGYPHVKKWLDGLLEKKDARAAYQRLDSGEQM